MSYGITNRNPRRTASTSRRIHRRRKRRYVVYRKRSNTMSSSPDSQDLSVAELDRAVGAVIGSATGDALGAGYEFVEAPATDNVTMRPGTLTSAPAGHWTDDTAMAIAILEVAADQGTLITEGAADAVGERFLEWYRSGPSD